LKRLDGQQRRVFTLSQSELQIYVLRYISLNAHVVSQLPVIVRNR
jgi:hypothetical protein